MSLSDIRNIRTNEEVLYIDTKEGQYVILPPWRILPAFENSLYCSSFNPDECTLYSVKQGKVIMKYRIEKVVDGVLHLKEKSNGE